MAECQALCRDACVQLRNDDVQGHPHRSQFDNSKRGTLARLNAGSWPKTGRPFYSLHLAPVAVDQPSVAPVPKELR